MNNDHLFTQASELLAIKKKFKQFLNLSCMDLSKMSNLGDSRKSEEQHGVHEWTLQGAVPERPPALQSPC